MRAAAIDRIVKASIRFASERKFDAFAENRKVAREAAFPCRPDLQCPVFRPAVLDVIADRERACLAYHAQNRLIEEFLAVENGRHNAEAHCLVYPLAKNPNCDQPSSDLAGNYRRIFGEPRNLVKRHEVWAV